MRRSVSICFASCFAALCLNAADESVTVDGIAARVNDHVVTVSDVMAVIEPQHERLSSVYTGQKLKERMAEEYNEALKSLIEKWLIIDSFEKQKLSIPEWLVQKRANEYVQNSFKGDKSKLTAVLARDRMTYEDWLAEIKNHIIVASMRSENVEKHVKVTPKDIKEAYDKNTKSFLKPMRMKLRMIIIDSDESDKETVKKDLAERVCKLLGEGKDFAELAKKYSDDDTSETGGDWGWVEPSAKLRRELVEPVSRLNKGEITSIIETPNAYFIVKCEDIEPESAKSFDEVQIDIEKQLRRKASEQLYAEWIERLSKESFVKIYETKL